MSQKIKSDELINIGDNIRKCRNALGMTQEEMTAKLQLGGFLISRATYSKIEMGIHHVSASQLRMIKDILGTTYEQLFEETKGDNK
jgi:transcriptional regulator with XRE-family HTH domain